MRAVSLIAGSLIMLAPPAANHALSQPAAERQEWTAQIGVTTVTTGSV